MSGLASGLRSVRRNKAPEAPSAAPASAAATARGSFSCSTMNRAPAAPSIRSPARIAKKSGMATV